MYHVYVYFKTCSTCYLYYVYYGVPTAGYAGSLVYVGWTIHSSSWDLKLPEMTGISLCFLMIFAFSGPGIIFFAKQILSPYLKMRFSLLRASPGNITVTRMGERKSDILCAKACQHLSRKEYQLFLQCCDEILAGLHSPSSAPCCSSSATGHSVRLQVLLYRVYALVQLVDSFFFLLFICISVIRFILYLN